MNPNLDENINYVALPHPGKILIIEPVNYANPYDFKKLHRHDYFEIILITEGEGSQLIDFKNITLRAENIYTIYPGQVHLLERGNAEGLLIQFNKEVFDVFNSLQHFELYFSDPVFAFEDADFRHLFDLTHRMKQLLKAEPLSGFTKQKIYSYLQIILVSLIECRVGKDEPFKDQLVGQFLALLTDNIYSKKKVAEYCDMLNCSADKLNEACKRVLGTTALQLIHEELILEIKRLMLLGQYSFKEIAYELNFDSQANFNGFVKNRTALSPGELQDKVYNIYK